MNIDILCSKSYLATVVASLFLRRTSRWSVTFRRRRISCCVRHLTPLCMWKRNMCKSACERGRQANDSQHKSRARKTASFRRLFNLQTVIQRMAIRAREPHGAFTCSWSRSLDRVEPVPRRRRISFPRHHQTSRKECLVRSTSFRPIFLSATPSPSLGSGSHLKRGQSSHRRHADRHRHAPLLVARGRREHRCLL